MDKLRIYKVSESYINYLREIDSINIKYNKDERRPYIGIVFQIKEISYFAPLASPKPKHLKMKNTLDFIKINNGEYGAINLNNMIPVVSEAIIDFDIMKEPDEKYKNLLLNQARFLHNNTEMIREKAEKLYIGVTKYNSLFTKRCANFIELEKKSKSYLI